MPSNNNTIILSMALITLAMIILSKLHDYHLKTKYVEVTATVVSMDSHISRSGRGPSRIRVYQPTLSYEWNGWKRTITPVAFASFWNYEIGAEIKLYINPNNANDYRMYDSEKKILHTIWWIIMIFLIVKLIK